MNRTIGSDLRSKGKNAHTYMGYIRRGSWGCKIRYNSWKIDE